MEDVVKLATDIYHTFNDDEIENLLWKMLKKKEFVFKDSFNKLTAQKLLDNWEAYQQKLKDEKQEAIENLWKGILSHYEDWKIKEEKLEEYK